MPKNFQNIDESINNVVHCLNDTETFGFSCMSKDKIKSWCQCQKYNNVGNYVFPINNTDLYSNSDSKIDKNITNFQDGSPMQVNRNCFQFENNTHWECYTNPENISVSICLCCDQKSTTCYATDGYVDTILVYQGLENFTFPLRQRKAENNITHQINLHESDENLSNFDYHDQYMLTYHNQNLPISPVTFTYIIIFSVIVLLILIYFICKNIKCVEHDKYYDDSDLSHLLSNDDVDEV